MSRAWEHYEPIPTTTFLLQADGAREPLALEAPRDGELVVTVCAAHALDQGCRGAVVEVVAVQEKDELVLGDRLWLFDRASCGHCEICRRGHGTCCPDFSRAFLPRLDTVHLVVPSWIARRARVRLPVTVSTAAAVALGANAWILRALRQHAPKNPLRILVVGGEAQASFVGAFLETIWPDARRVLWADRIAAGFHAASTDLAGLREALQQPADLVLCLRPILGPELLGMVCPGVSVVLAGEGVLSMSESLGDLEATVASSRGGTPGDLESFRKHFAAFSERWDSLAT